jgi:hypothetical protein
VRVSLPLARERRGAILEHGIAAAKRNPIPDLRRLAAGLLLDQAAVQAGLIEGSRKGQTEGHIQRLKALKRQMVRRVTHCGIAPARSRDTEGDLGVICLTLRRKARGTTAWQRRGGGIEVVRAELRQTSAIW